MASTVIILALASQAVAYPWVPNVAGVDSALLRRGLQHRQNDVASCPNNPNHQGAVPFNAKYPYCGAKGSSVPGKFPCNNNFVPAAGDTAHRYIAPGKLDIRGPCPGINTAANHGFLSRDGITTYNELVEMQQNVYGVGYDLANLLAVLGVGLDGDIPSGRLSIGCDATSRTSSSPLATKGQYGLNGHNKFEGDSSLTRNDYFTHNGDNFRFNRTLYDDMWNNYCAPAGACNLQAMIKYRDDRWTASKNENGNFVFGPLSLLLYGAASFLYELFPNGGGAGVADKATMDSFFLQEKLPDNWFSRADAYDIPKVGAEIFKMYAGAPKPFGSNTGKPNTYTGIGLSGPFSDGNLGTPQGIQCALYLLATNLIPASLLSALPLAEVLDPVGASWATSKLQPLANLNPSLSGCPIGPHEPGNPLL